MREPMNKNRIRGVADRGERAEDREAPVTKGKRRKSGSRAAKVSALIRGDLALRLKGRRRALRLDLARPMEREVSQRHSSRYRTAAKGRI